MEQCEIIELYFERDERAIEESKKAYGAHCHRIAYSVLGNDADAEETVSDAMLKAWQHIPPDRPAELKLYLSKITRNLALSQWRSRKAGKRGGGQVLIALEELGDCVPGDMDVAQQLDRKELGRTISEFLRREKERDRVLFLRRYFYLEDTASLAARYGLKEANVLQILSRTRRKLKQYLIREGYDL